MPQFVKQFLDGQISRRGFMQRMSKAGFSAVAVSSAVESLTPLVRGGSLEEPATPVNATPFTGTGGDLLAEQLKAAGQKYLFLGNGSGLGALCDALVDRPELQIILATHETHSVSMADGYSKASGQTPFVMFSRVGTPNASSNIYNAKKDRTPVVIAADHTDTFATGRDSVEDIENWLETVEQFTKMRWLVMTPERIPEWTTKAFKVASILPGGPSYLRFPRNILYAENVRSAIFPPETFHVPMDLPPNPRDVEETAKALLEAKSPLLYLGHETFVSQATPALVRLAELLALPVTQVNDSWSQTFPTDHPLFLGDFNTPMRFPADPDVFLNLGGPMPEPARFEASYLDGAKIIHGMIEAEQIGTAYPVHVAMAADVKQTAEALIEAVESMATRDRLSRIRDSRQAEVHNFVEAVRKSRTSAARRRWDKVPLTWERLAFEIEKTLDRDAYLVEEFGTQAPKALQWYTFAKEGSMTRIGRTVGRALGWGVGASIGVKLARPNNQVVCFQGDGGFLFGQSEALWSMSRYDVPVIVVIFNNRSYNETRVRMFGRGGRQAEAQKDMLSYLGDPEVDFVQIAGAYDIRGEQVKTPDQIGPAMQRAIETTRNGRPYLIDALVEESGAGANLTWYPDFSLAQARERNA